MRCCAEPAEPARGEAVPGSNDRPPLLSLLYGTPVTLTVSALVEDARLQTYLGSIRDRLGVVRLSESAGGGDRREVPIDRLFVEPLLTRRHVSPEENPSGWRHRTETNFDVLGGVGGVPSCASVLR